MQVWEHAAEQAEFLVGSREPDDFDAEDCYRQAALKIKQLQHVPVATMSTYNS